MDYKKFGNFVLIVGAAILLCGIIYYTTNMPKQFDRSRSPASVLGGRDDMFNALSTISGNLDRSHKRESGKSIMILGGIVTIVGFGFRISSKE